MVLAEHKRRPWRWIGGADSIGELTRVFVALTYALTTLSVAILLLVASRDHHVITGEAEIFIYPRVYRLFFAVAFLGFLVAGALISAGVNSSLRTAIFEKIVSGIGATIACTLSLAGFVWVYRYSITISRTELYQRGVFKQRFFALSDVGEVVVLQGFRGARDLIVRDRSGKQLLRVGGTIQDFDDLVRLVEARSLRNVDPK